MADKKCQQNFGGWETTGLMVTDLVEDRKMELHVYKRQSQELSQCEVLEQERFCH